MSRVESCSDRPTFRIKTSECLGKHAAIPHLVQLVSFKMISVNLVINLIQDASPYIYKFIYKLDVLLHKGLFAMKLK